MVLGGLLALMLSALADGTRRPFGAGVAIGAYEWRGWLRYLPIIRK
jgi:hypothetical protein